MDFKKATSKIMEGSSVAAIAKALGRSEASVRQARLPESANAYRSPPEGWEDGLMALIDKQMGKLHRLREALAKQRDI